MWRILNQTHHIEDACETCKITGAVFVDFAIAFVIVCVSPNELWELTKDYEFTELLSARS